MVLHQNRLRIGFNTEEIVIIHYVGHGIFAPRQLRPCCHPCLHWVGSCKLNPGERSRTRLIYTSVCVTTGKSSTESMVLETCFFVRRKFGSAKQRIKMSPRCCTISERGRERNMECAVLTCLYGDGEVQIYYPNIVIIIGFVC